MLRSLVYPAPNRGFARRLADHSAFATSALATASASGPVDVVVAESPPLFTAAAGVAYALRKRAALALNISDLWPESAIELGLLRGEARRRGSHALAAPLLSPQRAHHGTDGGDRRDAQSPSGGGGQGRAGSACG